MNEEKDRILKLIEEISIQHNQDEDPGIDYVTEYKKQTGKDLETGKFVTQ